MAKMISEKGESFELGMRVLGEAGYPWAMLGLSYNKKQPVANMPKIAEKLAFMDAGHNKFLEQIVIWVEVRAPRYIWQEMDTYRLSSKSSESTMHTILNDKLAFDNFELGEIGGDYLAYLNDLLSLKKLTALKRALPEGFMQKRLWFMSYKCLRNLILQRRNHRLPHWKYFIEMILSSLEHPELLPGLEG